MNKKWLLLLFFLDACAQIAKQERNKYEILRAVENGEGIETSKLIANVCSIMTLVGFIVLWRAGKPTDVQEYWIERRIMKKVDARLASSEPDAGHASEVRDLAAAS